MTAAERAVTAVSNAGRRVADGLWPVTQQAVAATVSWQLAVGVIHHHDPIFAPITTLIALNTDRGGRGSNAVRFIVGVLLGLLVADLMVAIFGRGYAAMGSAVLLALLAVLAINGDRLTMAQAGVSAIIVASSGNVAGVNRVQDALLGAAVALVVSQLLFPAHPLALLRRSEAAILAELAHALQLTAQSMSAPRSEPLASNDGALRAVYTELARLGDARDSVAAAVTRTPWWWSGRRAVEREGLAARHLDVLGNSCLSLTRTTAFLTPTEQRQLAPEVRRLAILLGTLAAAPGSNRARQRVADTAIGLARRADTGAGWSAIAMVLFDILVFAGVSSEDAEAILRKETTAVRVAPVPRIPGIFPPNRKKNGSPSR
ncbi:FUSC family protein [Nocardia rhizosphaerae]|uniref:FUSC family protein n=1 Tax=Nocardia rhizosphaerae TaxID=1691571 RepID=A0ABV8LAF2_9NOCA